MGPLPIPPDSPWRLHLHHMRPSVNGLSCPRVLLVSELRRSARIDRGDGRADLGYNIGMHRRHVVVAGNQHPVLVLEPLRERAEKRLVQFLPQPELRQGDGVAPPASLEFGS